MAKVGSPQKSSCIVHPPEDHFIMIRNDYMRVCELLNGGTGRRIATLDAAGKTTSFRTDGTVGIETLRCAAALLNYFESWTNHKIVMAEQTSNPDFWVWNMSAARIAADLLDIFPAKNVATALDWLTQESVLERRTNERNTLDKSHQYLLNVSLVQKLIYSQHAKNAQNPDTAHSPSRDNGDTLQGECIDPPGKTYKIHQLDSSLDSNIRSVSTGGTCTRVTDENKKEAAPGKKQSARSAALKLDGSKTKSISGTDIASSTSVTEEVKTEQQFRSLTSLKEKTESLADGKDNLEDGSSAATTKLINGTLHKIDTDGIILLPTTGKNKLASMLTLKTLQVWFYKLLKRCEVTVRGGVIYASDVDEDDRTIDDLKPVAELASYAYSFDCCLTDEVYNETIAEFFSFWVDWVERTSTPKDLDLQEQTIIDLLELEDEDDFLPF